jgi:hypothetical protein
MQDETKAEAETTLQCYVSVTAEKCISYAGMARRTEGHPLAFRAILRP